MVNRDAPGAAGPRAGSGFVGIAGSTTRSIAQAPAGGKPSRNESNSRTRAKASEKLIVRANGPQGPFMVFGQTAKALVALEAAGPAGRTALEVASWAYRFGAYVWTLRHEHRLSIETRREEHEGGWHARYVLASSVEVLEIRQPERRAA